MEGTPGLRQKWDAYMAEKGDSVPFICCYKEVFHIPCTIRPSTRHHGALRSEMDKDVQKLLLFSKNFCDC